MPRGTATTDIIILVHPGTDLNKKYKIIIKYRITKKNEKKKDSP